MEHQSNYDAGTDIEDILPNLHLRERLIERTQTLCEASRAAEHAYLSLKVLENQYDAIKAAVAGDVARQAQFSNDTLRKAEVLRRLCVEYGDIVRELEGARTYHYSMAQEVERLTEEVKTLRTIAHYEAARMERETATIN